MRARTKSSLRTSLRMEISLPRNTPFGRSPCPSSVRSPSRRRLEGRGAPSSKSKVNGCAIHRRSEEHTSELQSLMRISYAVFCLKKKTNDMTTEHETAYTMHTE